MINDDLTMTADGLALCKYYEGLCLTAGPDCDNVPTIGYGRIAFDDGAPVRNGDTCTEAEADKWLLEDIKAMGEHFVKAWITVRLTPAQYSALASFTFNRGAGRFEHGYSPRHLQGIVPLVNSGPLQLVTDQLLLFDWAGSPDRHMLGLQRRRRSERAMFMGQDWQQFKEWKP